MHKGDVQRRISRGMILRALMLAAIVPLSGSGCLKGFLFTPFAEPQCTLPLNMTKSDLVELLNANIARVGSWSSSNVTIRTGGPGGLPIKLSAEIAVARPRNFRLVAKSMLGWEADLGSNDERFWIWVRRGEPRHVFFARHDEADGASRRMNMPFRPDWLMEAMGVIPIDEASVVLESRRPDSKHYRLVSEVRSATGRVFRRQILVDSCFGRIVAHSLHDESGREIARADLGDYREYRLDEITTVHMPHHVVVHWPQSRASMTLEFKKIEVNPRNTSAGMWRMPVYRDYPPFNLARQGIRRLPRSASQPSPRFGSQPAEPSRRESRPQFIDDDPVWARPPSGRVGGPFGER